MKILLKEISHDDKVSKGGKPYTSCKLTIYSTKEQKDLWISGFGSSITKTWQAGDTIEVDLSQTEKGYWNFTENANSRSSKTALDVLKEISAKLDVLIGKDKSIEKLAEKIGGEVVPTINENGQEENAISVDQIPF